MKQPGRTFVLLTAVSTFAVTGGACDGDDEMQSSDSADTGDDDRRTKILALEGNATAGEALFLREECSTAACHGSDGIEGEAPDFDQRIPVLADEGIVQVLLDGQGAMPSQARFTDQELADVIAWLNETFA